MNASVEDKALELIKASSKGVLQSDLWKDLDIDSRKCSRVVSKLETEGKIKRTWETISGTRTYRLSYVSPKKEAPKKEYRFDLIVAMEEVAPCVGCTYECEPDYCPDLGNWIDLLIKEESTRIRVPEKIEEKPEKKPVKAPEIEEEPVKRTVGKQAKKPETTKPAKKPEPKPTKKQSEIKEKSQVKQVKAREKVKVQPEYKPIKKPGQKEKSPVKAAIGNKEKKPVKLAEAKGKKPAKASAERKDKKQEKKSGKKKK